MSARVSPQPDTTIAIIFGASRWPRCPKFQDAPSLERSAHAFIQFLRSEKGLGIPDPNIENLFDSWYDPSEQLGKAEIFIKQRRKECEKQGKSVNDLLLFYVGHGDFHGDGRDFYLTIQYTHQDRPLLTSITDRALGDWIRNTAQDLRTYLIIDCCFASALQYGFLTTPLGLAELRLSEALPPPALFNTDEHIATSGVALLAAAGRDDPAFALEDETYTRFTATLLDVLRDGSEKLPPFLSLSDLHRLVFSRISQRYPDGARPELQSLRQKRGRVELVPLFRNPAAQKSAALGFKELDRPEHTTPETVQHTVDTLNRNSTPQALDQARYTIQCPYCDNRFAIQRPSWEIIEHSSQVSPGLIQTAEDNVRLESPKEVIALPYARDVEIFDPQDNQRNSKWTKVGEDFFGYLNYESIGILHMEKGWKVKYCVACCDRCNKPESGYKKGLIDVFANFAKGETLSEMWPHLLKKRSDATNSMDIELYQPQNVFFRLSSNNFFTLISLILLYLWSIMPIYFQQSWSNFSQFMAQNKETLTANALVLYSLWHLLFIRNKYLQTFTNLKLLARFLNVKSGLAYWSNFAISRYTGYQKEGWLITPNAVNVLGGFLSSLILFAAWLLAYLGYVTANMSTKYFTVSTELVFWLIVSYLYGKLVWTLSIVPFYILGGVKKIPMNLHSSGEIENLDNFKFIEKICKYSIHSVCVLVMVTVLISLFHTYTWVMLWAQLTLIICFSIVIIRFHITPQKDQAIKIVEITKIVAMLFFYGIIQYTIGTLLANDHTAIQSYRIYENAELLVFCLLFILVFLILGKIIYKTLSEIKAIYKGDILRTKYAQIRKLDEERIDKLADIGIFGKDINLKPSLELLRNEIARKEALVNSYFTRLSAKMVADLMLFLATLLFAIIIILSLLVEK